MARYGFSTCEFCSAPMPTSSFKETVCGDCDLALKTTQKVEVKARAQSWAAKRKCRMCGDGLPVTRYFECLKCVPQEGRPVDDEWHCAISATIASKVYVVKRENNERALLPEPRAEAEVDEQLVKVCPGCRKEHPIDSFGRHAGRKDGRNVYCKPCHRRKVTEQRERLQESMATQDLGAA